MNKRGTRKPSPVDQYVKELPPEIGQIVRAIREIVRKAAPGATEEMKWGRPWYRLNRGLCYIAAGKSHVTFGFANGAGLSDPKGLLEGTGKGMRHVKVRSTAEVRKGQFAKWVKEAVEFDK